MQNKCFETKQMHRFCQERFLILAVLLTTIVCGAQCQNCAVPRIVTLSRDDSLRRECAEFGDVLGKISTLHVESILNITENPHNLKLALEGDKLIVSVRTGFCTKSFDGKNALYNTYIDDSWAENIELQAELNCTDGRSKVVNIVIPIKDENTRRPEFEQLTYDLAMEPCYNGTHDGTCPLNFESPIILVDQDRDIENAFMEIYSTQTDLIKITTNELELGYNFKSDIGKQSRRHQMNVYLYLVQTNSTVAFNQSSLSFDLFAYNNLSSPQGEHLYGKTTINLKFGEVGVEDPGNSLDPPIFTSSAYYAKVTSFDSMKKGSELEVYPYNISAKGEKMWKVLYEIHPDVDLFEIEPDTGKVRFAVNLAEKANDVHFWEDVKIYDIRAYLKSYKFLYSSVPLLVYFDMKSEGSTQSPSTPLPCVVTECPTPVTEPSTCPVVTCPPPSCDWSTTTTEIWEDGTTTSPDPGFTTTDPPANVSTTETIISSTWNPSTPPYSEAPSTSSDIPSSPSTTSTTSTPIETTSQSTTTKVSEPEFPETTTNDPEGSSTTETIISTTPSTSTTEISTTPVYDNTCGNCEMIVTNFTCPISEQERLYPDPYDCSIFHSCRDDGQGGAIDTPMPCPPDLVFCPTFGECRREEECCSECEYCKNDEKCLPPDHPNNICKGDRFYPDPVYCDLYHSCAPSDFGQSDRDCLMECADGLVWCPSRGECWWPMGYGSCPCEKEMRPPKCNLCKPKEHSYWTFANGRLEKKTKFMI